MNSLLYMVSGDYESVRDVRNVCFMIGPEGYTGFWPSNPVKAMLKYVALCRAQCTSKVVRVFKLIDQLNFQTSFSPHSNKRNHSLPTQNTPNISLHSLKPHSPTSLALKMIEQRRKGTELSRTSSSRAMICLCLVCWQIDMSIQALKLPKQLVAEIALIATSSGVLGGRGNGNVG